MGADIGLMQGPALADRARRGDARALAELYRREGHRAWRLAQAITSDPARAEGAVADAFARVLNPPATGPDRHAPVEEQLLAATRDAAIDRGASRVADPDQPLPVQAFRRLPERFRSALWLADVEGLDDDTIGGVLGLSATATAALVTRARAGLRERFVESHLALSDDPDCRRAADHLEAYAGGTLRPRAAGAVRRHLDACPHCCDRLAELDDLAVGIRTAVSPVPLSVFGTTKRAWAAAGLVAPGPLGMTLRGRPVPAWAEKAVAGAAAALITLGITAAVVAGGRGNARDPRLARQSTNSAPLLGGDGESALGGDVPLVVPTGPPTTVAAPDGPELTAAAATSAAPSTSTTTPPRAAAAPTVTTPPPPPPPPPAPIAPPSEPAAPDPAPAPTPEEPLVEVKVGVEGLVGVSVGDQCTGISVLGTPLLCDPNAGTGVSISGSLVGG